METERSTYIYPHNPSVRRKSFNVKAGVNMFYHSDLLNEVRTQSVAGRNKSEYYLRKSSKSPFIGNRCVRDHYRATSDKDLFFGCPGVGWVRRYICSERNILCRQIPG